VEATTARLTSGGAGRERRRGGGATAMGGGPKELAGGPARRMKRPDEVGNGSRRGRRCSLREFI